MYKFGVEYNFEYLVKSGNFFDRPGKESIFLSKYVFLMEKESGDRSSNENLQFQARGYVLNIAEN